MTAVKWHAKEDIIRVAQLSILQTDIVLDLGPGIRPQPYFKPRVHVCVEPFLPYIERVLSTPGCPCVFLNCTADAAIKLIPDKSVDTVFLLDVIEHMEKDTGTMLIKEALRVARVQVVVFTPLGLYPQEYEQPDAVDRWGMKGGKWQAHQSAWYPDDFDTAWELHACKDFHAVGQDEKPLDTPIGVFWAIWTNPSAKQLNYSNCVPRPPSIVKRVRRRLGRLVAG